MRRVPCTSRALVRQRICYTTVDLLPGAYPQYSYQRSVVPRIDPTSASTKWISYYSRTFAQRVSSHKVHSAVSSRSTLKMRPARRARLRARADLVSRGGSRED